MGRVALAKHSREEKHKQEQEGGSSADYLAKEKKWTQNVGMLAALAVPMIVSTVFTGGAGLLLWQGMLAAGAGYLAGAKVGEEAAEWIEEGEFTWGEERHSKGENISRGKFYKEEAQTARNTLRGVAEQTDTAMLTGAATAAIMFGAKELAGPITEGLKTSGSEKLLGKVGAMEKLALDPTSAVDVAKFNAMKKQASGGAIWDALTKTPDQMKGRVSGKLGKDMATMYKDNPESAIFKNMANEKPELFEAFKGSISEKTGAYKGGLKYEDFFNTETLIEDYAGASREKLHAGVYKEYLGIDVETGSFGGMVESTVEGAAEGTQVWESIDAEAWGTKQGYSAEFAESFQETSGKKFKGMEWNPEKQADPGKTSPVKGTIDAPTFSSQSGGGTGPTSTGDIALSYGGAPDVESGYTPLSEGSQPAIVSSESLTQTQPTTPDKDPFFSGLQYQAGPKKGQSIDWYPGKNLGNLLGGIGNLLGAGAGAVKGASTKVAGAFDAGKQTVNMLQQMKSGNFNPMDFMGKY